MYVSVLVVFFCGFLILLIRRGWPPQGASLNVSEFEARLKGEPKPLLLDVRTGLEFNQGHLPGAKHLPLQELKARQSEIGSEGPILLYCRSGHRSAIALHTLRQMGRIQSWDLEGGILAWQEANRPVQK